MIKKCKVLSLRDGMERKLDALKLSSFLGECSRDTSLERYRLEVSIRKLKGVSSVRFWKIPVHDEAILEFRKSFKIWLGQHKQYSFAVKIIFVEVDHYIIVEAPLQISEALSSWLRNYWGFGESMLNSHIPDEKMAGYLRVSIM